jgi:hypothetical protein
MSTPTTPMGNPDYDRFFAHVATYKQASNPSDYAALAAQCTEVVNTPGLQSDMRSCYSWLAWLSHKQLESIVQRQ